MIPNKVNISGYKRFDSATMYLDRKLIALVGPNEAGKSSFINALLSVENGNEYSDQELTKGSSYESYSTIVKVEYLIEEEELEKIKEFNGEGKPRYFKYYKTKAGNRYYGIIENIDSDIIKRNKSNRKKAIKAIEKLLANSRLNKFIETTEYEIIDDDDEIIESIPLITLLNSSLEYLSIENETISENGFEVLNRILITLNGPIESRTKLIQTNSDKLTEFINEAISIEKENHPKDKFETYLNSRRPRFEFFGYNQKYLKSDYTLEEIKEYPESISNLVSITGNSLDDVINVQESNLRGERLDLQQSINNKLKSIYSESWCQAEVYPQLIIDEESTIIQIKDSTDYNEITDRSEGFKQFISLRAFLALANHKVQPVLLVDEAELHLHYAAQSDLIKEFEKQVLVNSIIYTTHSAGCLPSDLGTGIRSVRPILKDDINTGKSEILNSIWQNEGGFSPILFAMGANVIAFTLARRAVIAEGPSETILLPRLFRDAMELENLNFQIAPGIASISKENSALFELESGKTSYVVDGDKGGTENKKKLEKGGVDKNSIVQLEIDFSLEDFIVPDLLISAIDRELRKSGNDLSEINLSKIPKSGRILWIEQQLKKKSIPLPSKVRIAENITRINSTENIVDKTNKKHIVNAYKRIINVLK